MNVCCNWNEQMLQYCSTVFNNRLSCAIFLLYPVCSFPRFLSFSSAGSSLFLPHCSFYSFPSIFPTSRLCALCCGCAEWLSGALQAMEEMDSKPYQPLSKGRHEMEMSYTSSSDESEDGRAHHRSYTSRETLPDYTHELRLTLGSHRERQSNYSQPQPGTMLRARPGCLYLPGNIQPHWYCICTQMDTGRLKVDTHSCTHIHTHTDRVWSLKGPMWITYYSPQWARRTVGGSQLPLLHGGDISLPQLN